MDSPVANSRPGVDDTAHLAARRSTAAVDPGVVPTKSRGPGVPIAVVAALGLITVATGAGLPVATGRTPPSSDAAGFAAQASIWQLCVSNRDLAPQSNNLEGTVVGGQSARREAEGCDPVERSRCADEAGTAAHVARAGAIVACLLHIAVWAFAVVDRVGLLGSVPGNAATRNKYRLVSWTVKRRRRVYAALGAACAAFVLAMAVASSRFLSFGCLGSRVSVDPGLILQFVSLLFGLVVAVVALFHTDTPDYEAINKTLEEQRHRVEQHRRRNTTTTTNNTNAHAAVAAAAANGDGTQRCVSSFVPEQELQQVRQQSLRNAERRPGAFSPAERSE